MEKQQNMASYSCRRDMLAEGLHIASVTAVASAGDLTHKVQQCPSMPACCCEIRPPSHKKLRETRLAARKNVGPKV